MSIGFTLFLFCLLTFIIAFLVGFDNPKGA